MQLIAGTALVTGGSKGIGLAIVKHLISLECNVVLMARGEADLTGAMDECRSLATAKGVKVSSVCGDVSRESDVVEAVAKAETSLGAPIQIAVNCAGVGSLYRLLRLPVEEWDQAFAVHARGTFLMTKTVAARLVEEELSGSIINITSLNWEAATGGIAHYSASKAAAYQFTRSAAIELGRYGIRVNAIAPGIIETPMTAPYLNDAMRDGYLSRTPLGRLGLVEDVARVAGFLASEESGWITGASLPVDGGNHLMGLHNYADAVGAEGP